MTMIAIANTKGGSGKTTVATNLAAHFAAAGRQVALADLDKQQSAHNWLVRRPVDAARIHYIDLEKTSAKERRSRDPIIVDCVAAMRRAVVKDVVTEADIILIPVLPSAFDADGTNRFLKQIGELKQIRKGKRRVGLIGNRLRSRARSADDLERYLAGQDHPFVARLRDSQAYAQFAADGVSLFDQRPVKRLQPLFDDWTPLLSFVDGDQA